MASREPGAILVPILVALCAMAPFAPILARPSEIIASPNSDLWSQDLGWDGIVRDSLDRRGRLPSWNPVPFAGLPLVGHFGLPDVLYPTHQPALRLGWPWLYAAEFALHAAWLALGTYVLARALGCRRTSAATAALALALSARVYGHLHAGHKTPFIVFSYVPWILFSVHRLAICHRRFVLPGLLFGAILLAGFAQFCAYAMLLSGMWLATIVGARTIRGDRTAWLPLPAFAGAVALGVALAAVQVFPSWLNQRELARAGGTDIAFAGSYSIDAQSLTGFVLPLPMGHPAARTYWGPVNYWERNAYVGFPLLVLAVCGFLAGHGRRMRWFLALFAGGAFLFALGPRTPVFPLLFRIVPGLNLFRVPSRAMLYVVLAMALLAGFAVDALLAEPSQRRLRAVRRMVGALSVLAGAAAVVLVLLPGPLRDQLRGLVQRIYEDDQGAAGHAKDLTHWLAFADRAFETVRAAVLAAAAILVALAVLLRLRETGRLTARPFAVFLMVLILAEGTYTGARFLSSRPPPDAPHPAWLPAGSEPFRVLDQAARLPTAEAMRHHIELVGGYDPGVSRRYLRYTTAMVGRDRFDIGTSIPADRVPFGPGWRRWWLDWLNAKYVTSESDLSGSGFVLHGRINATASLFENPRAEPRATLHAVWQTAGDEEDALSKLLAAGDRPTLIVEGTAPPPPDVTTGTARVVSSDYDELTIETRSDGPSMLLVSAAWAPGWKGLVDGVRAVVRPANVALRAVELPAGRHVIRLFYDPPGFTTGLAVSASTAGALALFAVIRALRARRPPARGSSG